MQWGKHMPPDWLRLNNTIPKNHKEGNLRFKVLPIVIIRDPFYWMKSMCKEWYDAKWEKPPDRRCPAFIKMNAGSPTNTTYRVLAELQQAYWQRMYPCVLLS